MTNKGGRPRTYHSRLAAGVGGRALTVGEVDALKRVFLLYSGEAARAWEAEEVDENTPEPADFPKMPPRAFLDAFGHVGDWSELLAAVEAVHSSYLADVAALYGTSAPKLPKDAPVWRRSLRALMARWSRKPARAADEVHDLTTLAVDLRAVLALLGSSADLDDPHACIAAAGRLQERLPHFPEGARSQLTTDPARAVEFERALARLGGWIVWVKHWSAYRASHIHDVQTVLAVCESPRAVAFPKWSRVQARDGLKRRLRALYRPEWQDERERTWRKRVESGERLPRPAPCDREFAEAVLAALNVPSESRPRKG